MRAIISDSNNAKSQWHQISIKLKTVLFFMAFLLCFQDIKYNQKSIKMVSRTKKLEKTYRWNLKKCLPRIKWPVELTTTSTTTKTKTTTTTTTKATTSTTTTTIKHPVVDIILKRKPRILKLSYVDPLVVW